MTQSKIPMLPPSYQEIVEQLDLILRARYPLIYIVGAEEEPIDFLWCNQHPR
jgi:hypothetical protein